MIIINIQNASSGPEIPTATFLKSCAKLVLETTGPLLNEVIMPGAQAAEITLRIVDAPEGQALNRQFRNKDYPTNVLSFPYDDIPGAPPLFMGDLVLCAPVIRQEALDQGKMQNAHWAHMVIHGCLHLLGYDHIDPQPAQIMETLEIALLNRLGFPNPYIINQRETS